MKVQIDGWLLTAERSSESGPVYGLLFDGSASVRFEVEAGEHADRLLTKHRGYDFERVFIDGEVFAGRDAETRQPDGTLELKVTHVHDRPPN